MRDLKFQLRDRYKLPGFPSRPVVKYLEGVVGFELLHPHRLNHLTPTERLAVIEVLLVDGLVTPYDTFSGGYLYLKNLEATLDTVLSNLGFQDYFNSADLDMPPNDQLDYDKIIKRLDPIWEIEVQPPDVVWCSRLIESLVKNIKIGCFCISETSRPEKLIDGHRRLWAIKHYIAGHYLLHDLELDFSLNGKFFNELTAGPRLRICKTAFEVQVIGKWTSPRYEAIVKRRWGL